MSLGKQIKQAEEKMQALQGKVSEVEQQLVSIKAERDLAQETVEKITKEFGDTRTALEGEIVKINASHAEEVKKLSAESEKIGAELKKAQDELAEAKNFLANPAFADAKSSGEKTPITDGGEAAVGKVEGLWDQLNKITDPAAKTKFWNENEAALKAEAKTRFKG